MIKTNDSQTSKPAFSTIELMVTIIVVMLIMASITPSITKKLNSRSVNIGGTIGTGTSSSIEFEPDCSHINSDCELCTSTTCMLCLKICPTGQYARTSDCTCQACSDLYGDDCLTCTNKKCKKCNSSHYIENSQCNICPTANSCNGEIKTQCTEGYYQDEQGQTSCKSCEEKDPNCATCNSTTGVCEICKDGYELIEGVCLVKDPCRNADCGDLAMCIALDEDRAICMTKYNIGDKTELPIGNATYIVTVYVNSCDSQTYNCCWKGNTSNSCDASNGDYSGCNRTVCNWRGAYDSCSKLTYLDKSWRLPTMSEWSFISSNFATLSKSQGSNGLMLCDGISGYPSALCETAQNCDSAYSNNCHVNCVWGSEWYNDGRYYYSYVGYGELVANHAYPLSAAFSVRCVADL